jgi:hypothetical protein
VSIKSDYENLLNFCEAEVVEPKCPIATVKDRGASFEIVLHEILPAITLHKPWRAAAFDKARESFTGNDTTPYAEFKAWEALAKLLGLKSDWIACTERMPDTGEPDYEGYLVVVDGKVVVAKFFDGGFCNVSYRNRIGTTTVVIKKLNATHWRPFPPAPLPIMP